MTDDLLPDMDTKSNNIQFSQYYSTLYYKCLLINIMFIEIDIFTFNVSQSTGCRTVDALIERVYSFAKVILFILSVFY